MARRTSRSRSASHHARATAAIAARVQSQFLSTFARSSGISRFAGYEGRRGLQSGSCVPYSRRSKTMRRNRLASIGVLTCGLVLAVGAGVGAGVMPAGAASSSSSTDAADHGAGGAERRRGRSWPQATGSATPTAPGRRRIRCRRSPRVRCRTDHGAVERARRARCCPARTRRPGRTRRARRRRSPTSTRRSMPARSPSGVAADAGSSCSTTSVGLNQPGGLANVNAPITAQDNAIGLLEPGGLRARTDRRSVLGVDGAERRRQRRRTGEHLLGQRRPRREHVERLRHHGDERSHDPDGRRRCRRPGHRL